MPRLDSAYVLCLMATAGALLLGLACTQGDGDGATAATSPSATQIAQPTREPAPPAAEASQASATLRLVQQTLAQADIVTSRPAGAAVETSPSLPAAAPPLYDQRRITSTTLAFDAATSASDAALLAALGETVFSPIVKAPRNGDKLRLAAFEQGLESDAAIEKALAARRVEPASARYDSLADYLAAELGSKFHRRAEWSGGRPAYAPHTDGSRKWEGIGPVKYVTIHHAEGVPDEHPARMIRNIFVGHTDIYGRLGGADVGYHFFVDGDGKVWEGRTARRMGTHVGSRPAGLNNYGNIGVCGLGTFGGSYPPKKMAEMLGNLPVLIARYYGRQLTVRGHMEWVGVNGYRPIGGTDCPGKLMAAVHRARENMRKAFKDDRPRDVAKAETEKPAASKPTGSKSSDSKSFGAKATPTKKKSTSSARGATQSKTSTAKKSTGGAKKSAR